MKAFYKYLLATLLFGGYTQADAQLARWDFEDPAFSSMNPSTAPTSVSAGIIASNFTTAGVSASVASPGGDGSASCGTYPGSPYPAPCFSYQATGWPLASTSSAVDLGKYHEFSIAAQPGCTFRLNGMQMAVRFNNSASIQVRTSYDNFAAPWGSIPTNATQGNWNGFTRNSGSGPPAGISGQTNLTLRIYFYNVVPDSFTPTPLSYIDIVRLIGTISCPMPVEFTSFEGKAVGNKVQLNWATSWERNADRFEVQRSQDASEFGSIGQVKAAGDATQKQSYGFTDEQALTGINYYRLRQVDRDGSVQFSKIIAVTTRPEAPAIAVLGNPTEGGRINLQLFNLEASQLRLTDMQGRSVGFRVLESVGGVVMLEPASPLSTGMYLVGAAKVPAVKIVVR